MTKLQNKQICQTKILMHVLWQAASGIFLSHYYSSSALPGGVCCAGRMLRDRQVQLLGIAGVHSQASFTEEPVPRQAFCVWSYDISLQFYQQTL